MGEKTTQQSLGGTVQTRLVNKTEVDLPEITPIGRSTAFGSQFKLKKDGGSFTREGSVEAYKEWFYADEQSDFRERVRGELLGETLGCYCLGKGERYDPDEIITEVDGDPAVCHGEVILEYLNGVAGSGGDR